MENRNRGRPEAIQRDQEVLSALQGQRASADIAGELSLPLRHVRLSLNRLRDDGKAELGRVDGKLVWSRADD